MQVIVFDIGGTLMEYQNMPNSWLDFYHAGFDHAQKELGLHLSSEAVDRSYEIFKTYNPRLFYREKDVEPAVIFSQATAHWPGTFSLDAVIEKFFESMHLVGYIYPKTIAVLSDLRKRGLKIATLTDIAIGMPEEMHQSYFQDLLPWFDRYVSSLSCMWRKPNPQGLCEIAEAFGCGSADMIMVGDEEKDIKTAQRFGCKSVYIDRKKDGRSMGQDHTIHDLRELIPLLELK